MSHSHTEEHRRRPEAQSRRWRASHDDGRKQNPTVINQDKSTPPKSNVVLYPSSFRTPNVQPSQWRAPGAPIKASSRDYRSGQSVDYPIVPPWQLAPKTEHYSSFFSAPFRHYPAMPSPRFAGVSRNGAHIIPVSTPKRSKSTRPMSGKAQSPPLPPSSYVLYRHPSALMADCASGLSYEYVGAPHLRAFRVKLPPHLVQGLDHIVECAESHAKNLSTGWKTELYSLTKCDLACRDIPGSKAHVKPIFEYICHAIQILYGSQKLIVDNNQPHILKYAAAMGHTGVELHHDRCDVTANLSLSHSTDYIGGGTMLVDIGRVVRLDKGEMLLHPGSMVHGGMDITEGTRYCLVTFAHLK